MDGKSIEEMLLKRKEKCCCLDTDACVCDFAVVVNSVFRLICFALEERFIFLDVTFVADATIRSLKGHNEALLRDQRALWKFNVVIWWMREHC